MLIILVEEVLFFLSRVVCCHG